MQENYQPVALRKILLSKGATREEIEEELRKYNPESESQSMTDTVLTVLREKNQVIRKEGNKFVINASDEFTSGQIENLVSACTRKILTFEIRFFIALGPWSNWDHTLKNPPFRWGVNPSSASNVGVFNALRPGDIVYFYANQDPPTQFSNRGLFGVGKIIRKYDEDKELYWPDEKLKGEVIYKHRFEIEPLKLVKSDLEIIPWIDGLPFTKGLNRIANPDTLEQLIDDTQKLWNIKLDSFKSNNWIWSVTPENWEIVKDKNIWASKIGQNIRERVRPGDKVIFYVQGTNEFQGIFEFVGEWYDAPEPVWSDEPDSVIYQSQIKLNPIKIGSVKVYDVAPELNMFPNPDDKKLINLVLKGGGGYPSNNGKPIVYQDYRKLLELMSNSNEVNYWKISPGEAGEDWENQKSRGIIGIHFFDFDLTGLSEDELRNKISEKYGADEVAKRANTFGQVRNFMKIKEGDVIVANSGKSKILGIGRVEGPYKFRKGEEFPHTFPVDWYDTTEGTIPKQEGWMITVIPLKKEEFDELTKLRIKYLLLRYSRKGDNQWEDEFGKTYHYGKIPNYSKLTTGSKVIWYDRTDGKYLFLGHGDVKKIDQNSIGDDLYAEMGNFDKYEPPKYATDELRSKITGLPNFNNQHSILQITKEIFDEIVHGKIMPEILPVKDKLKIPTPEDLKNGIISIKQELLIDERIIEEIITHLVSGRHILLAGPVGTGKTRLSQILPHTFWTEHGGYYSDVYTATSDWSTHEVIGGLMPKENPKNDAFPKYEIEEGCVTKTINANYNSESKRYTNFHNIDGIPKKFYGTWLVIDEFNRADIDKAFGPLFTALEYKTLKIPVSESGKSEKEITIPSDYRIIGTLNTADKHFLFNLSDALKRRFAYVEISIPTIQDKEEEIFLATQNALSSLRKDISEDENLNEIIEINDKKINFKKENLEEKFRIAYDVLELIRTFKPLGTAILKSIFQTMIISEKMNIKNSLDNGLNANIIPQIEDLEKPRLEFLSKILSNDLKNYLSEIDSPEKYTSSFESVLNYLGYDKTKIEEMSQKFIIQDYSSIKNDFEAKYSIKIGKVNLNSVKDTRFVNSIHDLISQSEII